MLQKLGEALHWLDGPHGPTMVQPWPCELLLPELNCEQSLFCSKIGRENERDGMRDIRAASGEAASSVGPCYVRLAASHITLARRCCFEFFLPCFPTDFRAKERLLAVYAWVWYTQYDRHTEILQVQQFYALCSLRENNKTLSHLYDWMKPTAQSNSTFNHMQSEHMNTGIFLDGMLLCYGSPYSLQPIAGHSVVFLKFQHQT